MEQITGRDGYPRSPHQPTRNHHHLVRLKSGKGKPERIAKMADIGVKGEEEDRM